MGENPLVEEMVEAPVAQRRATESFSCPGHAEAKFHCEIRDTFVPSTRIGRKIS